MEAVFIRAWTSSRPTDGLLHATDIPANITRLPRGFLVEANKAPGILLEATVASMRDLEGAVQQRYPVFHREMGPVWTGTLQSIFTTEAKA